MRKATIRTGEKVIEVEVSDDEVRALLGLEPLKQDTIPEDDASNNETSAQLTIENERSSTKLYYTSSTATTTEVKANAIEQEEDCLPLDNWEPIIKTKAEIRGRKEQSKYIVYRYRGNTYLVGAVKSKSHLSYVRLGSPDDQYSIISYIMKAVNALPFHSTFTRRTLCEALPSNLARGHILKFALDYMVYAGLIIKLKERDIDTGAISYKRVLNNSMRSSSEQLGQEAAGTPQSE
jgi:hypothetical protein